jgi:hypothetical protein
MAVDFFTKGTFETELHQVKPNAKALGLVQGEEVYACFTAKQVRVLVRSSVRGNGVSAGTGQDSIRLIIEVKTGSRWQAVGKGPDAYTTRVTGWEKRLAAKLTETLGKAKRIKVTLLPGEIVRYSTTAANPGRPFSLVKDVTGGTKFSRWLDV